MDVRTLVLATLASLPLHGCVLFCHPPKDKFAIDTNVDPELVAAVDATPNPNLTRCDQVCRETYAQTSTWQVSEVKSCELTEATDDAPGHVTCEGVSLKFYCKGRRPLGHVEAAAQGGSCLGRQFAAMAHLEAASVVAFEQLQRQLAAWGASAELQGRCLAAAEDERRHAAWLTALAQREGCDVPEPRTVPHDAGLLAAAIQNATEGCVFETFAVVVASSWSEHAIDPRVRRIYRRIADDELRHAQLAWDLHGWFLDRLTPEERTRVEHAHERALASLPTRARQLFAATQDIAALPVTDAEQLASSFVELAA